MKMERGRGNQEKEDGSSRNGRILTSRGKAMTAERVARVVRRRLRYCILGF
jgi:hypothetical protein